MDYGFSEEQQILRKSVQDFLKNENPNRLVRQIEENKQGYSSDLYQKMAGLGLLGMMIPEEYGGAGGDWVSTAILYEEGGRALLQSPHFDTAVLAAQLILLKGSEDQKKTLLPRIANGEIVISMALTEEDAGLAPEECTTSAMHDGNGWLLTGRKLLVRHADTADFILTNAKVKVGSEEGTALFLVDGKAPELGKAPMETFFGETMWDITYNNVKVAKGNMLGDKLAGKAVSNVLEKAKVMLCAEMLGMAEASLQLSIDHSKMRMQFDRLIGAYQALQHDMARMWLGLQAARWLTYFAAWTNSQAGESGSKESNMAQLWTGNTCRSVLGKATQIHGGMGIMKEHDLSLYWKRTNAANMSLGYRTGIQENVAKSLGI